MSGLLKIQAAVWSNIGKSYSWSVPVLRRLLSHTFSHFFSISIAFCAHSCAAAIHNRQTSSTLFTCIETFSRSLFSLSFNMWVFSAACNFLACSLFKYHRNNQSQIIIGQMRSTNYAARILMASHRQKSVTLFIQNSTCFCCCFLRSFYSQGSLWWGGIKAFERPQTMLTSERSE